MRQFLFFDYAIKTAASGIWNKSVFIFWVDAQIIENLKNN
jgi:hypothetical protein